MTMPPEPPPEGVLIESARKQHPEISIREAARRAGISEGWWRQVVKGYQSHSGGTYGIVRDVPAETVARMAQATGRITPQQMEDLGQRADAAAIMRRPAAAGRRDAVPFRASTGTDAGDPALAPYLESVYEALAEAMRKYGPAFTGAQAFSEPYEAEMWDDPGNEVPDDRARARWIARFRRVNGEHAEEQARNAVLMRG